MNLSDKLFEQAKEYEFTGDHKFLKSRIDALDHNDLQAKQNLCDHIWALGQEFQTSLIRELAKRYKII